MPSFSIIIPSFNQVRYISETLENIEQLKSKAIDKSIKIQIILVDNCSDKETLDKIKSHLQLYDHLLIEKDLGQFDAINKGIKLVTGDYWTWLNTDDLIDISGFFMLNEILEKNPETDYIYGDVAYIDEHSKFHKQGSSGELSFSKLMVSDASISQPGSFFKTKFTKKIGELSAYQFAFDYEYILRCFKNNAKVIKLENNVAYFRYYSSSKSGSKDYRFLKEQLIINRQYGGGLFSKLSMLLHLRILKRKLFN